MTNNSKIDLRQFDYSFLKTIKGIGNDGVENILVLYYIKKLDPSTQICDLYQYTKFESEEYNNSSTPYQNSYGVIKLKQNLINLLKKNGYSDANYSCQVDYEGDGSNNINEELFADNIKLANYLKHICYKSYSNLFNILVEIEKKAFIDIDRYHLNKNIKNKSTFEKPKTIKI